MTHDNIRDFQEKLHNTFLNPTFQKPIRHPDVSKVDRFLGKKGARKFLGRNRSSRGKVKSRRKNNYKTLNARKILQSRHGVANALKKIDNKYLLTYGDIAKLMRKFHYVYDQMLRKWIAKTPSDKKKEEPIEKKADKEVLDKGIGDNGGSGGDKDKDTGKEEPENKKAGEKPFEFKPIDKKEKKPEHKDRLKILQARIILIANGEEQFGAYDIIPNDIQFKIPDEQVLQRMSEKNLLWLKKKDKWVMMDGKDPNPSEKRKGTLGRAILVDAGEPSFLSFEEADLDVVEEHLENLGYEWIDSDWVNTEEKPSEESVKEEEEHSPEYWENYYGCREENGDCPVCQSPLQRVRSIFYTFSCWDHGHAIKDGKRVSQYDRENQKKLAAEQPQLNEAGGTSSSPAAIGPGQNSQGISRFDARLGSGVKKRKFL